MDVYSSEQIPIESQHIPIESQHIPVESQHIPIESQFDWFLSHEKTIHGWYPMLLSW